MPNLYNKLMAKDMPRAAAAPTSRQMVEAPMGLRSAMKRYAAGGETPPPPRPPEDERMRLMETMRPREEETRRPVETMRPPEMETRRPPEEPRYEDTRYPDTAPQPRYSDTAPQPRYPDTAPPPVEVRPEIYPQDYAGPRTSNTSQTQQVGPRTSYRQEADGTLTEIGYDGQPVSGYTPEQWAMHNATTGVTPSEFQYVWNGEGYTKVPAGESMVNPLFSQNPEEAVARMPNYDFGYNPIPEEAVARMPNYDFGYNPIENVVPQIPFNPADIPTNGYNEPEVNYQTPNPQQNKSEYERLDLLRRAISGQGLGSNLNSQKIAQLLQSLGYSK